MNTTESEELEDALRELRASPFILNAEYSSETQTINIIFVQFPKEVIILNDITI